MASPHFRGDRMNWKLGLFRLWVLATVLWLLGVGYFAFKAFHVPLPLRGDYQYSVQIKEMPWNTDWSKPLYEIIYPPGKGPFPDEFPAVGEEYIQKWDEDVKAGKTIRIEFPDSSNLYLNPALTEQDQTYLANLFWQNRWYRYWSKIAPWLATAFGPPIAVLLLGLGLIWVRRGFARKIVS
jgi:hypothetical protein